MRTSLRTVAGALLYDWIPFEWNLRRGRWVRVCNRREQLVSVLGTPGVACAWRWSSDLHLSRVFPSTGRRLMRAALETWPVAFADAPVSRGEPEVSFVLGHRGAERIPHLLLTLASMAGQREAVSEVVVVEQSNEQVLPPHLPPWVSYVHTPLPYPEMPYSRSWALNVGIRHARGRVIIPGDNDLVVPALYAREARNAVASGGDVVDLKRFVFYLGEADTTTLFNRHHLEGLTPESVTHNLQGGTIAATRDALEEIGGFDESLIGWGGEDNELWERAAELRRVASGYLPFVHLWHAPQPGRLAGAEAPALRRYALLSEIPVARRIAALRERAWGSSDGPTGVPG